MRRLNVLLITNFACCDSQAKKALEGMGHWVEEHRLYADSVGVFDRVDNIDAVLMAGYSIGEAEMVARAIREDFDGYTGIISPEAMRRAPNQCAHEIIPELFLSIKDALEQRFGL